MDVAWTYAQRSADWEPWQREYRFGALYLFPPDDVRAQVDRLRRQYDPRSAAICTAHVSLSEPLPRAITKDDLSEISSRLEFIQPFLVTFSRPHATTPYPGVVYSIEPAERIVELQDSVHATSLFADVDLRRQGVAPHMTIAEFITLAESLALDYALVGHVAEGSWLCEEVVYAIPDDTFRFHPALALPLSQPSGPDHK
jgi:hypothetical protein